MQDTCTLQIISNCTVGTCPLSCAQVEYLPTIVGHVIYIVAFNLLVLAQFGLGIKYNTPGFMIGMICGLILEVVGYVGRIMLHGNPFDFNNFIIYLVPIKIAPAFLASSLYLCLCRIIIFYGQQISRFSPRSYAITFMTSDFISLVLQGAGGGLAATANNPSGSQTGRAIMIAGVVFQVLSLLVFMGLWLEFVLRLRRTSASAGDKRFVALRGTKKFAWFQYALGAAVVLIFIRSVYRVTELHQGFNGPITNDQASFMILEGPMILLAVLALTMLHPGIAFGESLRDAAWSVKQPRKALFATTILYPEDVHL